MLSSHSRRCTSSSLSSRIRASSFTSLEWNQAEDRFAARLRRCNNLLQARRIEGEFFEAGLGSSRYLTNLLTQTYGSLGSVEEAAQSFERAAKRNAHSWNFIIVAYAQNGHLQQSRRAFDLLPAKSCITWNTMMTLYLQSSCSEEVQELFDELPEKDVVARNIMVTSYAQDGHLEKAQRMFDTIPAESLDVFCWNNILSAHSQNGNVAGAKKIFDGMAERNVVSWNAMISGYVLQENFRSAIHIFRLMKQEGTRANSISFACVAEACAASGKISEARALVSCIEFSHSVGSAGQPDLYLGNVIVTMLIRCGSLDEARGVYDRVLGSSNSFACTSLLCAYAQAGRIAEAWKLFRTMSDRDVVAWTTMISACCSCSGGRLADAEALFSRIPARDSLAWSTMILGFSANGEIERARELHELMPCKGVHSWTALITGHVRAGHDREALEVFKLMDLEGIEIDPVTFVSALEACANSASLLIGRSIHRDAVARGFEMEIFTATSLVNMFGKCGRLEEARGVFNSIPNPNIVSWTTIIVSYARCGERGMAGEMFRRMELQGEEPNWITFCTVLGACSYGGLLEAARDYFLAMAGDYSIDPIVEHYRCMVDVLGRSGELDKMEGLIDSMPFDTDEVAWTIVLNACSLHGDAERGTRIAKRVMASIVDRGSSLYILLANLYTTV